jgi:hypothetical protein
MRPAQPFRVNLGGEGEVAGALNQQGPWVLLASWFSSRAGMTLAQLVAAGHEFLICDNLTIPLPDGCADETLTNWVPVDISTSFGPGVQTSEILRILKPGGVWIMNGYTHYTKP